MRRTPSAAVTPRRRQCRQTQPVRFADLCSHSADSSVSCARLCAGIGLESKAGEHKADAVQNGSGSVSSGGGDGGKRPKRVPFKGSCQSKAFEDRQYVDARPDVSCTCTLPLPGRDRVPQQTN